MLYHMGGRGVYCQLGLGGVGLWPVEFVSFHVTCHHFWGGEVYHGLWVSSIALAQSCDHRPLEESHSLLPFPHCGCP